MSRYTLHRGEALAFLRSLPDASVDALITDPPYSSGGMFRGDRAKSTDDKYTQTECRGARPDFAGDNRDQRSFLTWCTLWLSESLRVLRPGAPVVLFTDWRQLPVMTDAVQAGGFIWRGIAVWDKTERSRPQMDAFRSQCEYVVWGSAGAMERTGAVGVLPGLWRVAVTSGDKHHQTGKPTPLMREIVKICPPGGLVLDPFAGSGTTGVAALAEGRRFIGCEMVREIADVAEERLRGAAGEHTPGAAPLFAGRT